MTAQSFRFVKVNNTTIPGITDAVFDEREVDAILADDGQLHVTSAQVMQTAPIATFTTRAARSLALLLGTGDEVPVVALDGTNGIDLIGAKADTVPGLESGSVHARRQFLNGLLLLDRLSYRPGDDLMASATAFARSTAGGTDPVIRTPTTAPTLPLGTERCGLSTLSLGGTSALRGLLSLDIEIQHQVENNSAADGCYDGGLPHPVLLKQPGPGGASMVRAVVETLDLTTSFANGALVAAFAAGNHLGVGLSASTLTASVNGGLIRTRSIRGPGGAAARRIEVIGAFNGSTRPFTLATA